MNTENSIQVAFRVDKKTHDKIKEIQKREDRSFSKTCFLLLKKALEQEVKS